MSDRVHRRFLILVAVVAGFLLVGQAISAKDKDGLMLFSAKEADKGHGKSDKALPEIPENLDRDKINELVAGLGDDQVRRLLLQELEKSAVTRVPHQEAKKASGLTLIAQRAEENFALFHQRLYDIRAGAVAVPRFLPQAYAGLRGHGGTADILLMFAGVFFLLGAGIAAEWRFGRATADMRQRLASVPTVSWMVKFKRLFLTASVEFFSICIFTGVTLLIFFCFLNRSPVARLVLMIYLVVVLGVRGIGLISRFLLAPHHPALRCLPLSDSAAGTIHRWVMAYALVIGAGVLITGLLELQGISEEGIIFLRALNAAVVLGMLVSMVLGHREAVARIICHGTGDRSVGIAQLRSQLAFFWHLFALPYLLLAWCLWVFYLLVGRSDLVIPIFALFSSVPLFFILDWLGQKSLSAMFGLVDKQEAVVPPCAGPGSGSEEQGVAETEQPGTPGAVVPDRWVRILRSCLSLSLAGIIFFWLVQLWGFEAELGEDFTAAAFKILLIVSLAWVAWRLIEDAINRKLREVQGSLEVDEDSDAGGTGGSRLGTLLQIFRKFLLVVLLVTVGLIVLSAMGIDTKPLLAGAGILGLAIGLGTQNLIKDIVSGLFFLIDDAFRIGDYVESGKAKGTVEGISIRSLKLRHTRGMVHIVPFSQLGTVTNFSRDYNITKLDFRVPFDTDVDKVRKVVKKIDKEIQQDEELGPNLLGPIKCAGVLALDDSALIMRVKFKSKPGHQFMIQRQVFRRLKELFDEKGLEFATRHVMVRLPDEPVPAEPKTGGQAPDASSARRVLSGGAAAAIAALAAEEEARKKALLEENDDAKS